MRSDPGKSPADTTGAGSSGVRCGSWLSPRDALCGERGRGRGAPCQRCQLCSRRKSHSARVIEPRAQRLELTRLSVEATRLLLQQPTLVIDETAQIGQRRIRCRLGVCRRKCRRDQRRGDRDSEGARRVEMSHGGATRATRMPKRGSCVRAPRSVRRARVRRQRRASTRWLTAFGDALTACRNVAVLRSERTLDGTVFTHRVVMFARARARLKRRPSCYLSGGSPRRGLSPPRCRLRTPCAFAEVSYLRPTRGRYDARHS